MAKQVDKISSSHYSVEKVSANQYTVRVERNEKLVTETKKETTGAEPKIAALKTKIKAADMVVSMQEHAVRCVKDGLASSEKPSFRWIASRLKKEFDEAYGPAWHCIVGTSFGSFVTYSLGGFFYFSIGKTSILLFKTTVQPIEQ